jgi:uncharacterized protein (TIGR02246 family)
MDAQLINGPAVRAWLDAFGRAWSERDPSLVLALFTHDAHFQERRFRRPLKGRDAIVRHWETMVRGQQRDVSVSYDLLAVRGERAYAHWRGAFTWLPIGRTIEVDAVAQIGFSHLPGEYGLLAAAWDEWVELREH